jgi:hypothetical protein
MIHNLHSDSLETDTGKYRESHLIQNPSQQHAATAATNELVRMENSPCMLVGGFQVIWVHHINIRGIITVKSLKV